MRTKREYYTSMFAELACLSNFTFLTGASHPEEYMRAGLETGVEALAVADVNSVAGIVRAHVWAREVARKVKERAAWDAEYGEIGPPRPPHLPVVRSYPVTAQPRLIPAARLRFTDAPDVIALPQTRIGWGRLSRLLSVGRLRAEKGDCSLQIADLLEHAEDLHLLLVPQAHPQPDGAGGWGPHMDALTRCFGGRIHLMMAPQYDGRDHARFAHLTGFAQTWGIPTLASAAPCLHHGSRRRLGDVLTAIRSGCRVEDLGRAALCNGEQRLRSEAEMLRIFKGFEDAVHRAGDLAGSLTFSLDELRYDYPDEGQGETPSERLARLAHAGLRWRYPAGAPQKVQDMLEHELTLIGKLNYEPYFLTVNDIVDFARSRNISCVRGGDRRPIPWCVMRWA